MSDLSFGASLSVKQCRDLGLEPNRVLGKAIHELGLRRFRFMSYWDEVEAVHGEFDFKLLDKMIAHVEHNGGQVTLCIGARQPRYPECHIPGWAKKLDKSKRDTALLEYIKVVVNRYKDNTTVISWQLENEAFNRGIGECIDFDRQRLIKELKVVKKHDHFRPVIMTTSNTWSLPIRAPKADLVGISLYMHQWGKRGLSKRHRPALFHAFRSWLIKELTGAAVFCHELQLEPWGPRATQDLNDEQQEELFAPGDIPRYIDYAIRTNCQTIDMWGLEWWYWRKTQRKDARYWNTVKRAIEEYSV